MPSKVLPHEWHDDCSDEGVNRSNSDGHYPMGTIHYQQHVNMNLDDNTISHNNQELPQFPVSNTLFLESSGDDDDDDDRGDDNCIGNHLFFRERQRTEAATALSAEKPKPKELSFAENTSNKDNQLSERLSVVADKKSSFAHLFTEGNLTEYSSLQVTTPVATAGVASTSSSASISLTPTTSQEGGGDGGDGGDSPFNNQQEEIKCLPPIAPRSQTNDVSLFDGPSSVCATLPVTSPATTTATAMATPVLVTKSTSTASTTALQGKIKSRGRSLSPTHANQLATTARNNMKVSKQLQRSVSIPTPANATTNTPDIPSNQQHQHLKLLESSESSVNSPRGETASSQSQQHQHHDRVPPTPQSSHDDHFSQGNILLVFALTFSHMKSQAEGMVLRNIVALQRSLIMYPSTVLTSQRPPHAPSFPAHVHSMRYNRVNVNQNYSPDLEVYFMLYYYV